MSLARLREPGAEGLQQVDHALGKSLFAEYDVQVARPTHQRRVASQWLGQNLHSSARHVAPIRLIAAWSLA